MNVSLAALSITGASLRTAVLSYNTSLRALNLDAALPEVRTAEAARTAQPALRNFVTIAAATSLASSLSTLDSSTASLQLEATLAQLEAQMLEPLLLVLTSTTSNHTDGG